MNLNERKREREKKVGGEGREKELSEDKGKNFENSQISL